MKYYIFLLTLIGDMFLINVNQIYAQSADAFNEHFNEYTLELTNTITGKKEAVDTGSTIIVYLLNAAKVKGTLVSVDSNSFIIKKYNVNPLLTNYVAINPEEIYLIKAGSLREASSAALASSGLSFLIGGLLNMAGKEWNSTSNSIITVTSGTMSLSEVHLGRSFFFVGFATVTTAIIFISSKRRFALVAGWDYRIVKR